MAHTWLSSVKKKIYILPTNKNVTYKNNSSDDDSNIVKYADSIEMVTETKTQVVAAI